MSEPEIARRCLSCGASVRGQASFCPQCGNPMDRAAKSQAAVEQPPPQQQGAENQRRATPPSQQQQGNLVAEAERVAATLNDKLPTLSGEAQASGNHHNAATEAAREPHAHDEAEAAPGSAHASQSIPQEETAQVQEETAAQAATAQGDTRGRVRQRAAAVGASVGENLRPRVEKLREASTV
ncbi:MAG TPA: hypothetical protein VER76_08475, partial [Pyrinomonadaceae bacterium]|nr:hypothetical protein [Pyrinomonadaceae bacterium]